jgi:hypothetical protein
MNMTNMRKSLILLLFATISVAPMAKEENPAHDLMLVSKMAGVCGVMQQMAAFQKTTKMPGGAEFIERFWRTELARLGKSQAQFFKECEQSIEIYGQYTAAFDAPKK